MLTVKNERELKKLKDKSVGQQAEAVFGKELGATFKSIQKRLTQFENRLKKLERTDDRQSMKAYAMASQNRLQVVAILERLERLESPDDDSITESG